MKEPKLYVLIPVHNRPMLTQKVLECLEKQTDNNFDTIVIDDGSTDGTPEMIRHRFPTVKIVFGNGSLFWTGAINLGLGQVLEDAASDDIILLLNDDLEFDEDYLSVIRRLVKGKPGCLVGSVVVDIDQPDTIFDGGCLIDFWTAKYTFLHQYQSLSSFSPGSAFEVSTLTGRGVAIPVKALQDIGLYDEQRFKHRGDTELPIRAKRLG